MGLQVGNVRHVLMVAWQWIVAGQFEDLSQLLVAWSASPTLPSSTLDSMGFAPTLRQNADRPMLHQLAAACSRLGWGFILNNALFALNPPIHNVRS
jgi:hypothetical protein